MISLYNLKGRLFGIRVGVLGFVSRLLDWGLCGSGTVSEMQDILS